MFKALIGICVVTQFNVGGGSICYLAQDDKGFKTHLACMQHGNMIKRKMVDDFVKMNGNSAAVIGQAACMKMKGDAEA